MTAPYKLASRDGRPAGQTLCIRDIVVGAAPIVVMATPLNLERASDLDLAAAHIASAGAAIIGCGALKPRATPYSFCAVDAEALRPLRRAADRHGLLLAVEVMEIGQIPLLNDYADLLRVGAHNMQHFNLLKALGRQRRPVLLERAISATVEDLLLSAEYLLAGGNETVVLCECGIRTFETFTRNTMDISAIPVLKHLSHLPVFAAPSHATGRRDAVLPMARAAVAAGADGLLIDVHQAAIATSHDESAVHVDELGELMRQVRAIAHGVDRCLAEPLVTMP